MSLQKSNMCNFIDGTLRAVRTWVLSRALRKHLPMASALITACILIWMHRILACDGLVYSLRQSEKLKWGLEPNLIENFVGGVLYACMAHYILLPLVWLEEKLRNNPVERPPLNCLWIIVLGLVVAILVSFGWESWISIVWSLGLSAVFLIFFCWPLPTIEWLSRHSLVTIGVGALSIWMYRNFVWKMEQLHGKRDVSTLSCGISASERLRNGGHHVIHPVSWTHAWPQLILSLAGVCLGLVVTWAYRAIRSRWAASRNKRVGITARPAP
jgi:hypothetical protein